VVVYAYPESYKDVCRIAEDERLKIEAQLWEPTYKGKNGQFINKIRVAMSLDCDVGLYIDADTTVHGDLSPLFYYADQCGFCATQFNDWLSNSRRVRGRIARLQDFKGIDQSCVERAMIQPYASVNGGVFAFRPESDVLPAWDDWTVKAKSIFIADETVLHALLPRFSSSMVVATGGQFNCSPIYQPAYLKDEAVVVRHYHGDSNLRIDNKSRRGCELWWPYFKECVKQNIGGLADWHDTIGNKQYRQWMRRVVEELGSPTD
jgi:hypothetical protein